MKYSSGYFNEAAGYERNLDPNNKFPNPYKNRTSRVIGLHGSGAHNSSYDKDKTEKDTSEYESLCSIM